MTTVNPFAALNSAATAGATKAPTANEAGSADRFLKLLVTQMQNQDPLNPMDNAQITSQMAQINTVNGISTLNTTVQGLNSQFAQLQVLQGASLVGRDVTVQGNLMAYDSVAGATVGVGGFELDATASRVKIEVVSGAGRVVDSIDLGAQTAGTHSFNWKPASGVLPTEADKVRFRVVASNGAATVTSTALMRDRVEAVSLVGDKLTLETSRSGQVPYADIKAFN
jgi:flagellar basal-body rod modification protein FlgD